MAKKVRKKLIVKSHLVILVGENPRKPLQVKSLPSSPALLKCTFLLSVAHSPVEMQMSREADKKNGSKSRQKGFCLRIPKD